MSADTQGPRQRAIGSNTSPVDPSELEGPLTDEEAGVTPEENARLDALLAVFDREEVAEQRVNLRFPAGSLSLIRKAAAAHGVPYQTYLKQVAVRAAITDLKDLADARRAS